MKSNWNAQEEEVINLLGRLKTATPEYPANKLAKRRAAFIAVIGATTISSAAASKIASRLPKSIQGMTQFDKVILSIEMAAVTGLTVYVGVTAYVNRDDLKKLLLPNPTPALVAPLPSLDISTSLPLPTMTGESTPTPMLTSTLAPEQEENAEPTVPPESQPPPPQATDPPPDDRPGLHLGQTKTPKP